MGGEFIPLTLGAVCSKIGSGATPRGGKEAYRGGATSLIRSQNIYNDRFVHEGLAYIDDDQANELRNVVVEADDVLLNITGDSVARCCQVDPGVLPARVNQHVAIIRPRPETLDARFLRYSLVSPVMQAHLLALASAGATRNALTKGMLEKLVIAAPSLPEQRAIAHILGTLDDKIELNRRRNQTLEAMARALFKDWFVDFGPVRAKMEGREPYLPADLWQLFPDRLDHEGKPEGWSYAGLSALASIISKGTTPSKAALGASLQSKEIRFLKVKDITESGEIERGSLELIPRDIHETALKRSILKTDDLLYSIAGTIGRVAVVDDDLSNSNCNQAIAFVRLRDKQKFHTLIWLLLSSDQTKTFVESKVVQGVQANASLATIGAIPVLLPSDQVMNHWNALVTPLMSSIRENQSQSRGIAQLRDTLLPKLISGELRSADAEKFLEAFGL